MIHEALPDETCAALYFDQMIGPDDIKAGFPEDFITNHARPQYIRDASANHEAIRQIREHLKQQS